MLPTAIKVWRYDGVINWIASPGPMITVMSLLSQGHSPWACHVLSEIASLITDQMIVESTDNKFEIQIIRLMRDESLASHKVPENSRMSMGKDGEFDGLFVGTMHPVEFAAILYEVNRAMQKRKGTDIQGTDYIGMTLDYLARRNIMVTQSEYLALMDSEPVEV